MGTGTEIALDVEFPAKLRKGKSVCCPRDENDGCVFTSEMLVRRIQATQTTTSEMSRWIQEDSELDPVGIHFLLGHRAEYELANLHNPSFGMACKLPKSGITRSWGDVP